MVDFLIGWTYVVIPALKTKESIEARKPNTSLQSKVPEKTFGCTSMPKISWPLIYLTEFNPLWVFTFRVQSIPQCVVSDEASTKDLKLIEVDQQVQTISLIWTLFSSASVKQSYAKFNYSLIRSIAILNYEVT